MYVGKTHPNWSMVDEGSVDKERAGEFDKVKSWWQLAALAVEVGLHVWEAVVCLFLGQVLKGRRQQLDHCEPLTPSLVPECTFLTDLVELFFSDIGFVLGAQCSECTLYFLTGLDVFCLTADHECHVFLQWHVAIPADAHSSPLKSKPSTISHDMFTI